MSFLIIFYVEILIMSYLLMKSKIVFFSSMNNFSEVQDLKKLPLKEFIVILKSQYPIFPMIKNFFKNIFQFSQISI